MIWRTDKPEGSPIVVYRNGNPRPEVLFLATKPYPHYYDDGGEEIPDGMIQKWASLEEKSEKPIEGLEKEIKKCWQEWVSPSNKQNVEGVLPFSEFAFYARHFAKWQKEQLMSEAVEGEVLDLGINYLDLSLIDAEKIGIKESDKVRIIIVKEDSHE